MLYPERVSNSSVCHVSPTCPPHLHYFDVIATIDLRRIELSISHTVIRLHQPPKVAFNRVELIASLGTPEILMEPRFPLRHQSDNTVSVLLSGKTPIKTQQYLWTINESNSFNSERFVLLFLLASAHYVSGCYQTSPPTTLRKLKLESLFCFLLLSDFPQYKISARVTSNLKCWRYNVKRR